MRRNKYRESFKAREHDVFKIKTKESNNNKHSKLCGILEYEELRTRKRKQHKMFLDNIRGSSFKTQSQEGFFYVCIVCNRCMYVKSVAHFRF